MTADTRIAEARTARDEGMDAATNAADMRLVLAVDKVIAELNATGMPWSANDARAAMPVVSPGLIGARVKAATMRRPLEMTRVGWVTSDLVSTKAKPIGLYVGVTQ